MKLRNSNNKAVILLLVLMIIFIAYKLYFQAAYKPSIPAWLSDIPIPPQTTITQKSVVPDNNVDKIKVRYVANLVSDLKTPEISAWYIESLRKFGWQVSIPPADPKMLIQQLDFEKAGPKFLTVSLVYVGNKTQITLNLRPGIVVEDEEGEEEPEPEF